MTPRDEFSHWLLLPSNARDGLTDAELVAVQNACDVIERVTQKHYRRHPNEEDRRLLACLEAVGRKLGFAAGIARRRAKGAA